MSAWWLLAAFVAFYVLLIAVALGVYWVERRAWRRQARGRGRATVTTRRPEDLSWGWTTDEEPEPRPTEAEYAEAAAAFQREFNHDICENCGAEWIGPKSDDVHRCAFCNFSTPTPRADV